jgi:MFS family permease
MSGQPGLGTVKTPAAASAWRPFGHGAFAVLWTATVVSNVGTWMSDVGAGWLMTTLDPTPLMVALVQAATALPVFLFALPAGALADILDRRKLLIVVNILLGLTATALAALVALRLMTVELLLLFTFLSGAGAAFLQPAWQAMVPKLVPRPELPAAIALNSMGINVSRAIGPALAGVLIAAYGLVSPFLLNALSFVGIIAALIWWKPSPAPPRRLPPERMAPAIRAGLRHAIRNRPLRATLLRAAGFFLFASAYWALLPLIARGLPGGGPELYGLLLGGIGAGAVGGALGVPRLRAALGANRTVAAGTAGTCVAMILLAAVPDPYASVGACMLAGACWIAVLSCLHVSAQTALPGWVRARGLSVFLTVFFGCMAGGSLAWGQVAMAYGVDFALAAAAIGAAMAIPLTWRAKLGQGEGLDLAPGMHWPQPLVAGEVAPDRGPVMVLVEYSVDPGRADAFLAALAAFSGSRRRDGAYEWGVFEDVEDPGRYVEYFLVDSWLEHLRQHERMTHADQDVQAAVRVLHLGAEPPRVRHLMVPALPPS